jgi:hypothetical protein
MIFFVLDTNFLFKVTVAKSRIDQTRNICIFSNNIGGSSAQFLSTKGPLDQFNQAYEREKKAIPSIIEFRSARVGAIKYRICFSINIHVYTYANNFICQTRKCVDLQTQFADWNFLESCAKEGTK